LINNPVEINRVIKESPFSKYKMINIRTNKKLNIIRTELENPSKTIIEELLNATKLGKWKVDCYLPRSDIYRYGVISPVSNKAEIAEIKTLIEVMQGEAQVQNIERLKRRIDGEWTDSVSLKIKFEYAELPKTIAIAHNVYRVSPYVGEPLQCFKCQRLGHLAASCRSKIRCLLCGGSHSKDQCQNESFHCANCQGNHKANSRECHYYETARQIESVRAQKHETYQNAREFVLHQRNLNIKRAPFTRSN
jgi:hypothetical protein